MDIIAFIPARCGSESIKLKNIKKFCGKPLLYWNLIALQNTKEVSQIVVATDCSEIENTVQAFELSKVKIYRRSAVNASNTSSTESVMLEYIEHKKLPGETIFILSQATSPMTQTSDFQNAIKYYLQSGHDSVLSCVRTKRFFWNAEGEALNYNYKSRPRRQDFDGILMENGAFYINNIKNIRKHQNRLSGSIGIYEMPEYTSVEIDEEDDWIIAESLMQKHILTPNRDVEIKLFLTDIDGVLTDAGMYYSEKGDELKKFNTRDGMGMKLLQQKGIPVGIITSENRKLNTRRAEKLNVDYFFQGIKDKLEIVKSLCLELNIKPSNIAYIGDDINDFELLTSVGLPACPADAAKRIKAIPGIHILNTKGGEGVVREFIEEYLLR
jgi:N-acylneuraminate cytidylyltransferase